MPTAEELYVSHEKLIYNRAREYSRWYKTDMSDAVSESSEIFCRVVKEYNPDLGKFSTFLYNSLEALRDKMRKQKHLDEICEEYSDVVTASSAISSYELQESAENCLSVNGKLVLEHIFLGTFNAGVDNGSEISKLRIKRYLKEVWNWKTGDITKVMAELEKWYKKEVLV